MSTQLFNIFVSDTIGTVSAKYTSTKAPQCILTLAHGAGAGMDHSFMEALAGALADKAIASLRYNFPFAEHGKGRPDRPATAHATVAAAIAKAQALDPDLPLFVGGKSFGGRMSSQYLSDNPNDTVKGLVFYGFPLHPTGKPGTDRAEHLKQLHLPMLFLQGTKDALANWTLMKEVHKSLPTSLLVAFDGIDHSFRSGRADIITKLVAETVKWMGITDQA